VIRLRIDAAVSRRHSTDAALQLRAKMAASLRVVLHKIAERNMFTIHRTGKIAEVNRYSAKQEKTRNDDLKTKREQAMMAS
jgi:hypothetical protein